MDFQERKTGFVAAESITFDETIETIHDITWKSPAPTPTITNATPAPNRRTNMLKPSFRFFIIPLGAVCTLASLSAQNAAPRTQRDTAPILVREQVVDCGNKNPSEICVISYDSETIR